MTRSLNKARTEGKRDRESLLARLRRRGWRMTAQRRAIAESLSGDHLHLTADQIYERAIKRLPELSRASVYNTLNELRSLGEVIEINIGTGPKRYDPNTNEHHQHLICDRCGSAWDVRANGENALAAPEAAAFGFTVQQVEIMFHGLCATCATPHRR